MILCKKARGAFLRQKTSKSPLNSESPREVSPALHVFAVIPRLSFSPLHLTLLGEFDEKSLVLSLHHSRSLKGLMFVFDLAFVDVSMT